MTLTCKTDANPAVDSYTWYKVDGEKVAVVGSKKRLSTTVSEVDSQFYCKVSNKYGTQNSSITHIDVQCKSDRNKNTDDKYWSKTWIEPILVFVFLVPPKGTTVIVDPTGPILEGSSVSLFCRSHANPSVSNYTWYRDDEEDEEHGPILVINVADPRHSGDYHCEAKNDLGEEISAPTELDVQCKLTHSKD